MLVCRAGNDYPEGRWYGRVTMFTVLCAVMLYGLGDVLARLSDRAAVAGDVVSQVRNPFAHAHPVPIWRLLFRVLACVSLWTIGSEFICVETDEDQCNTSG